MSQFQESKIGKVGNCAVCGKPVPKRDTRDKGAVYCGRVHAALAVFGTRYRGTNSGPLDRPTTAQMESKTRFQS